MPALNLELTYFVHRKTKRLIGLLGRGAEVLPLKLWAYCGIAHPVDGSLADYSDQEIETLAEWWGTSGRFIPAMLKVGFFDGEPGNYRIHQWEEHQGHIAAFHVRAKKGALARWEKIKGDASSNATSIAKDEPKQCPKPNLLNQTKPSEENGEKVSRGEGTGPPADVDPASVVEDWARAHASPHLRTPEFYRAFGTWMLARDRKPGAIVVREQLNELAKKNVKDAIASCMYSARGGYSNICDPKTNGHASKKATPKGEWAKKPYHPG